MWNKPIKHMCSVLYFCSHPIIKKLVALKASNPELAKLAAEQVSNVHWYTLKTRFMQDIACNVERSNVIPVKRSQSPPSFVFAISRL